MRPAHDPKLESEGHCLRAASRAELHKNALEMPVHRPLADTESTSDLLRGLPERDVCQDLDFSPREGRTHGLLMCLHRKDEWLGVLPVLSGGSMILATHVLSVARYALTYIT